MCLALAAEAAPKGCAPLRPQRPPARASQTQTQTQTHLADCLNIGLHTRKAGVVQGWGVQQHWRCFGNLLGSQAPHAV